MELDTLTKGQVTVEFRVSAVSSISTIYVYIPVRGVEFYVVKANIPFLLSLADMDRLWVYFDNL